MSKAQHLARIAQTEADLESAARALDAMPPHERRGSWTDTFARAVGAERQRLKDEHRARRNSVDKRLRKQVEWAGFRHKNLERAVRLLEQQIEHCASRIPVLRARGQDGDEALIERETARLALCRRRLAEHRANLPKVASELADAEKAVADAEDAAFALPTLPLG